MGGCDSKPEISSSPRLPVELVVEILRFLVERPSATTAELRLFEEGRGTLSFAGYRFGERGRLPVHGYWGNGRFLCIRDLAGSSVGGAVIHRSADRLVMKNVPFAEDLGLRTFRYSPRLAVINRRCAASLKTTISVLHAIPTHTFNGTHLVCLLMKNSRPPPGSSLTTTSAAFLHNFYYRYLLFARGDDGGFFDDDDDDVLLSSSPSPFRPSPS